MNERKILIVGDDCAGIRRVTLASEIAKGMQIAFAEMEFVAGQFRDTIMAVGNYLTAIQPKKPKYKGWQRPYKYHK